MTRLGEMAEEIQISYGSCEVILTIHFGMRCVSAKFFPQLQTQGQKEINLSVASYMHECAEIN